MYCIQTYHLEAHSILEEDVVVLADGKVMGVEEGLVHAELLASHLLPVLIKLVDVNGHLRSRQRLDLTARTNSTASAVYGHAKFSAMHV